MVNYFVVDCSLPIRTTRWIHILFYIISGAERWRWWQFK